MKTQLFLFFRNFSICAQTSNVEQKLQLFDSGDIRRVNRAGGPSKGRFFLYQVVNGKMLVSH